MSFTPAFLDELRARLSLAAVVSRKVRLVKRGRDYVGLCPFHKEKSPSFNVVEDKGFFHCFGCGAHGDVIGFAMQHGNLGFREAVEGLAAEAGLEVPRASPQEMQKAQRQLDLQGAMEAACVFFSEQLWAPRGAAGLTYLRQRGLDEATIRRFRLGFAPDGRDALKRALGPQIPEELLLEGGLLRRPEGGGTSYDWFRNRVIFPIGDRSGRIIAFGGRVIGEGQPKYLNSPDTPLFQKGRVLYGWAAARAAAAQQPSAIVTEGYMDVIALHRAGFGTAVAPLGTALTETQIEELWRLAPEPILCFDGDAAGERAAMRAAERALPLLRPGVTLRFAQLPVGEDPDTLILRFGATAMREILDAARPLGDIVWTVERGAQPLATPERRAAFEQRLEDRVRTIADRKVAENYRQFFRERMFEAFAGSRRKPRRSKAYGHSDPVITSGPPPALPDPRALLQRRQEEILIATIINHPALLGELQEDFAAFDFSARDLDKLRRAILNVAASSPDLDAASLKGHLSQDGFSRAVDGLLSPQVYVHARFSRPDADLDAARTGWLRIRHGFQQGRELTVEIDRAERELAEEMTEVTDARLTHLVGLKQQREDGTEGPEEPGEAPADNIR
jgi:DNA primase